jgi:hypothetical protein
MRSGGTRDGGQMWQSKRLRLMPGYGCRPQKGVPSSQRAMEPSLLDSCNAGSARTGPLDTSQCVLPQTLVHEHLFPSAVSCALVRKRLALPFIAPRCRSG